MGVLVCVTVFFLFQPIWYDLTISKPKPLIHFQWVETANQMSFYTETLKRSGCLFARWLDDKTWHDTPGNLNDCLHLIDCLSFVSCFVAGRWNTANQVRRVRHLPIQQILWYPKTSKNCSWSLDANSSSEGIVREIYWGTLHKKNVTSSVSLENKGHQSPKTDKGYRPQSFLVCWWA